uniref:ATP-dependent Clp protease proteolytic subunit n=1 Tax=Gymnochlora stellata TaxID=67809 RepID=B5A4F5_GYMST|nr:chloroplast ATP-dependent Clp protease proteolytic subunit 5 [Gymnochlora stellata]
MIKLKSNQIAMKVFNMKSFDNIIFIKSYIDNHISKIILSKVFYLVNQDITNNMNFLINSSGGDIKEILILLEYLDSLSLMYTSVGLGKIIGGSAFILATANNNRILYPNAILGMQIMKDNSVNNEETLVNYSNDLARLSLLFSRYVRITKKAQFTKIIEKHQRNVYFTPKEALQLGIIDRVIK